MDNTRVIITNTAVFFAVADPRKTDTLHGATLTHRSKRECLDSRMSQLTITVHDIRRDHLSFSQRREDLCVPSQPGQVLAQGIERHYTHTIHLCRHARQSRGISSLRPPDGLGDRQHFLVLYPTESTDKACLDPNVLGRGCLCIPNMKIKFSNLKPNLPPYILLPPMGVVQPPTTIPFFS